MPKGALTFRKFAGRGIGPALNYKRLTVRMPVEIYALLEKHANENGIGINLAISWAIKRGLDNDDKKRYRRS